MTQAKTGESLAEWATREGIDLGDEEDAGVVGYWCRVANIRLDEECGRRGYTKGDSAEALDGWRDADSELRSEARWNRRMRP